MQLLSINKDTTLSDLYEEFGDALDRFLHLNGVKRVPKIGKAFIDRCNEMISDLSEVTYDQKISLLNGLTTDSDIFEYAALMDDIGWKILSACNTLPEMMRVPDSIRLQDSTEVMGNGESVPSGIYNKVMQFFKNGQEVNPSVFNEYSVATTPGAFDATVSTGSSGGTEVFQWFKIPWGEVTLHSSIDDSRIDFPVYPEELGDGVKANYTTMPEMLYQYEPWQIYQSSGPREMSFSFHFHRDMWTGDHRDGKANELIRACEANCYPEYKGSAVNSSIVTLYIHGNPIISGIMTSVTPHWSGPLGLDGFYLECKLDISITEVSETKLDFYTIKNKPLIG